MPFNIHSLNTNKGGGEGGGTMPPTNSLVNSLFRFLEFLFIPIEKRKYACKKFGLSNFKFH